MQPTVYSRSEQEAAFVPTTERFYDVHCDNNRDVSGGCQPIKILSGELLVEPETGPAENRKIAQVLTNHPNMSKWVIEEEAWECIWTELIINKKGLKTFIDREGLNETSYNFSEEMLEAMLAELDRLIQKYSGPEWYPMEISQDLVSLLNLHKGNIDAELQMVKNNSRLLKDGDFLGPKERRRRKMERIMAASPSVGTFDEERSLNTAGSGSVVEDQDDESIDKDYSEWFNALHRHLLHRREKEREEEVIENERRRRARQLNRVPTINRKLINNANTNTGN